MLELSITLTYQGVQLTGVNTYRFGLLDFHHRWGLELPPTDSPQFWSQLNRLVNEHYQRRQGPAVDLNSLFGDLT